MDSVVRRHDQLVRGSLFAPAAMPHGCWDSVILAIGFSRSSEHFSKTLYARSVYFTANQVQIPARSLPQGGIVPDDATSRRVFSGISRLPLPFIPALLHAHLNHPNRLSRPRCYETLKFLLEDCLLTRPWPCYHCSIRHMTSIQGPIGSQLASPCTRKIGPALSPHFVQDVPCTRICAKNSRAWSASRARLVLILHRMIPALVVQWLVLSQVGPQGISGYKYIMWLCSGPVASVIPSGAAEDQWLERFQLWLQWFIAQWLEQSQVGCSGPVARGIPSEDAKAQWLEALPSGSTVAQSLEHSQMGPQRLSGQKYIKKGRSGQVVRAFLSGASVASAIPSGDTVARVFPSWPHWLERFQVAQWPSGGLGHPKWSRSGPVARGIPSEDAMAQWLEQSQVGPQWLICASLPPRTNRVALLAGSPTNSRVSDVLFPPPLPYSSCFTLACSQDLDVTSRADLSTHNSPVLQAGPAAPPPPRRTCNINMSAAGAADSRLATRGSRLPASAQATSSFSEALLKRPNTPASKPLRPTHEPYTANSPSRSADFVDSPLLYQQQARHDLDHKLICKGRMSQNSCPRRRNSILIVHDPKTVVYLATTFLSELPPITTCRGRSSHFTTSWTDRTASSAPPAPSNGSCHKHRLIDCPVRESNSMPITSPVVRATHSGGSPAYDTRHSYLQQSPIGRGERRDRKNYMCNCISPLQTSTRQTNTLVILHHSRVNISVVLRPLVVIEFPLCQHLIRQHLAKQGH
ncbi:hypothetical protein PR048_001933 [Dryococelus australis]|uniref:Uncharacterized protein n=1 Tax=Dryococelus australis TaxID=614101 RepID=A0ABQ9IK52_9NEOP|nr:hypothetical protein PR048_001933 [Dryococelus australis]